MLRLAPIIPKDKHDSCHVTGCKACELGSGKGVFVVKSILPTGARAMIIAEAPGEKENDKGIPLIGPSGQIFNEALREVGINRGELAIANIVSCFPGSKVRILTISGYKQLRLIKIGELVLTHTGKYKRVTHIIKRGHPLLTSLVEFSVEYTSFMGNKKTMHQKVTPEHPFLTQRGWVNAGEITENDMILALGDVCEQCGTIFFQTNVEGRTHCSISCFNKTLAALPETKKKLSDSMHKQYLLGNRDRNKTTEKGRKIYKEMLENGTAKSWKKAKSWNKGKTKYTDSRIERGSIKSANTNRQNGNYDRLKEIGTIALRKYKKENPLAYLKAFKTCKHAFTKIENIFAWGLKKENIAFERQFVVSPYTADFRIVDTNILIECDGYYHNFIKGKVRDSKKDSVLQNMGYVVLRFTDKEINTDVFLCILKVKRLIKNHNGEYVFTQLPVKSVRHYTAKISSNLYNISVEDDESYVVKGLVSHNCRPPENRKPKPKEIEACYTFLKQEIEIVKPEVIVPMGNTALQKILKGVGTITNMRGQWYDHSEFNCKVFPTYHPAFILRYPQELAKFVSDFRQLRNYLDGKQSVIEKVETKYFIIKTREQMEWLCNILHREPLWSCDTETTSLNPRRAEIFIITFSWDIGVAALLDTRYFEDDLEYFWSKVEEIMTNDSDKVFQNASFDIQCFYNKGVSVTNYRADTMLQSYLLDEESANGHGLEIIAKNYTDMGGYDIPLEKYRKENKITNYKDIPIDIIHPYSLTDADVTYRGYKAMVPLITAQGLDFVNDKVMVPTSKILAFTEYNGVSIDIPYLKSIDEKYTRDIDSKLRAVLSVPEIQVFAEECKNERRLKIKTKWIESKTLRKKYPTFDMYLNKRLDKKPDLIDSSFNINSDTQLRKFLIDKMKLPVLKITETKLPSVDDAVLQIYAQENSFCRDLTEYRGLLHLKSTFIDGTFKRLEPDGKLHTHYLLHSTVTGRPSARDPNLNNIPRTSTATDIKDQFCGDWNEKTNSWDWLVEEDLGQAEFRCWIMYSQDPQAMRDLSNGVDIHKLMAAPNYHDVHLPAGDITYKQFVEISKDVTKKEREATKRVIFGLMYGRGAPAVAAQLGITVEQAERIIAEFFGRYSAAKRWLTGIVGSARRDGYVENFFGRRRRLPRIHSKDNAIRSSAERMAKNSPIQSMASDLVFLAMGRIYRRFWQDGMLSRMVLTVYDSIVFNCPGDELEIATGIINHEMCHHPFSFINVPITADLKIGTHWGSLVEMDRNKPWDEEFGRISKIVSESNKKFLAIRNFN